MFKNSEEKVRLFNTAANYCGLSNSLNPEWVPKPLDNIFNGVLAKMEFYRVSIERIKSPVNRPRIIFGLFESYSANASAFKHKGDYFIGVNAGTVLLLTDLFFRLLCLPDVMPKFGRIEHINIDIVKRPRFIADARNLPCVEGEPIGLSIIPSDEMRREYATYLTEIALEFLFMHEWQHIEGGHLDYLSKNTSTFHMNELEKVPTEVLLTRQLLELDADAAATRWSVKITLDDSNDHLRFPPVLKNFFKSQQNRYQTWLFSIGVLFRFLDQVAGYSHFNAAHPPIFIRYYLSCCLSDWLTRGAYKNSEGEPFVWDMFALVDQSIKDLHTDKIDSPSIETLVSNEGKDGINRLISAWPAFRKNLNPFAEVHEGSNAPADYFNRFIFR